MKPDTTKPGASAEDGEGQFSSRLAWFVGIWALSIATLTMVAMAIKWVLA